MTKIIQFKGENEEHTCPSCELVASYISEVVDVESPEELFSLLSELVEDAKDLGVQEFLAIEIHNKMELLDRLSCGCDDCDCED